MEQEDLVGNLFQDGTEIELSEKIEPMSKGRDRRQPVLFDIEWPTVDDDVGEVVEVVVMPARSVGLSRPLCVSLCACPGGFRRLRSNPSPIGLRNTRKALLRLAPCIA